MEEIEHRVEQTHGSQTALLKKIQNLNFLKISFSWKVPWPLIQKLDTQKKLYIFLLVFSDKIKSESAGIIRCKICRFSKNNSYRSSTFQSIFRKKVIHDSWVGYDKWKGRKSIFCSLKG